MISPTSANTGQNGANECHSVPALGSGIVGVVVVGVVGVVAMIIAPILVGDRARLKSSPGGEPNASALQRAPGLFRASRARRDGERVRTAHPVSAGEAECDGEDDPPGPITS